ncbi:MAG TPA: hypothetical protein DIT04_06050 [Dysgonomonas sp.]|nr:hypothetical protein [Dysgonomonas sp.]
MDYIPTPLISEELLKLHSPITSDVDITDFVPYIVIAQDLYVAPVLGEPLMDELRAQIETNSLTGGNSALIVKIAPVLAFYTLYQGLPFHWASIVNKGITIRESENSKGIDMNDLAQLRRWVKDDAERFTTLLIEFLCKCRINYPLWRPAEGFKCCGDVIGEGSTRKGFDSGFYFPNRPEGCGC